MKEPGYVRALSICGLGAALLLLVVGSHRVYSVNPDPNAKPELPPVSEPRFDEPSFAPRTVFVPPPPPAPTVTSMSDRMLVVNTTFTGVVRKDDQLYLTYDPAQQRGKRACPT